MTKRKRVCACCSKQSRALVMCAGCDSVFYCDRNCQKKDWGKHRKGCKKAAKKRKRQQRSKKSKTRKSSKKKENNLQLDCPLFMKSRRPDFNCGEESLWAASDRGSGALVGGGLCQVGAHACIHSIERIQFIRFACMHACAFISWPFIFKTNSVSFSTSIRYASQYLSIYSYIWMRC